MASIDNHGYWLLLTVSSKGQWISISRTSARSNQETVSWVRKSQGFYFYWWRHHLDRTRLHSCSAINDHHCSIIHHHQSLIIISCTPTMVIILPDYKYTHYIEAVLLYKSYCTTTIVMAEIILVRPTMAPQFLHPSYEPLQYYQCSSNQSLPLSMMILLHHCWSML